MVVCKNFDFKLLRNIEIGQVYQKYMILGFRKGRKGVGVLLKIYFHFLRVQKSKGCVVNWYFFQKLRFPRLVSGDYCSHPPAQAKQ